MKIRKIERIDKVYASADMTPNEYANAVAEYIGPKIVEMLTDENAIDGLGIELDCEPTEEEKETMAVLFIDRLAAWLENRLSSMYSCENVQFETIIEKPEP